MSAKELYLELCFVATSMNPVLLLETPCTISIATGKAIIRTGYMNPYITREGKNTTSYLRHIYVNFYWLWKYFLVSMSSVCMKSLHTVVNIFTVCLLMVHIFLNSTDLTLICYYKLTGQDYFYSNGILVHNITCTNLYICFRKLHYSIVLLHHSIVRWFSFFCNEI